MIYPPWDSTDMINEKYEIITSPEYSQPNDSTIYTSLKTKQMINQSVDSNCVFEYSTEDANLIIPKNVSNTEILKIKNVFTDRLQLSGRSINNVLQAQDKGLGNDYNIFSSKKTISEIKNASNELQTQFNNSIEAAKPFTITTDTDYINYKLKIPDTVSGAVLSGMNVIACDESMLQVQGSNLRHYKKFGEDIYTNSFETDEILIKKLMINETVNGIDEILYSNTNDAETHKLLSESKTNEIIDTKISDSQFMTENVELASDENINYDYRFKKENAQLSLSSINAENYINFKNNQFMELYKTADITDSFTTELDDRDLLTGGAIQKLISLKPSSGFKYMVGDVLNLFSVTNNPNNDEHKNYLPNGAKYYLTSITTIPVTIQSLGTKWRSYVQWRIVDNVLDFSLCFNSINNGVIEISYDELFGETNTFFSEIFQEINDTGFLNNMLGFTSSAIAYGELSTYSVGQNTYQKITVYTHIIEDGATLSQPTDIRIEFFSNAMKLSVTALVSSYTYWSYNFKFKIQTYNKIVPISILQKANIQRWTVQ